MTITHLDEIEDAKFDSIRLTIRNFLEKTVKEAEPLGLCGACLCRLIEAEASNKADQIEEEASAGKSH